jgi:hypothetical protein
VATRAEDEGVGAGPLACWLTDRRGRAMMPPLAFDVEGREAACREEVRLCSAASWTGSVGAKTTAAPAHLRTRITCKNAKTIASRR